MSLLSQLAPSRPGSWTTVQIATSGRVDLPDADVDRWMAETGEPHRMVEVTQELTRILLGDAATDEETLARVEVEVDEFVDLLTPSVHTRSRFELVSLLSTLDDAIGDVRVTAIDAARAGPTVFVAWRASGRFRRPAFLDDDRLLEPNGAVIRVAGVTHAWFTDAGRVDRIRFVYDRLSVIEQMVAPFPMRRPADHGAA